VAARRRLIGAARRLKSRARTTDRVRVAPFRRLAPSRPAVRASIALTGAIVAVLTVVGTAAGEPMRPREIDPVGAQRLRAQVRWTQVVSIFNTASASAGADQFYVAADAASALTVEVVKGGWTSAKVPDLVTALTATANPDGGYGLAKPWDAFQDGTVNPANTTYTATTAGHVGPILLAGYLAGAIPAQAIDRAIDAILDMPRSYGGRCIPYSTSRNDLGKPCVWNTHFGAADWVMRASQATGHRPQDAAALVRAAISWLTILPQNPVTGFWPYSSAGGGAQDLNHQLWTASAVDDLVGNHDALVATISKGYWRVQAKSLHDYGVAGAMSAIALFDCHYATDPVVLQYAGSTLNGNPYVFRALAVQAREVLRQCLGTAGTVTGQSGTPIEPLRDLG
jgi:hypothetical protein